VIDAGIALDGAADHGVSESIYLRDPDENGVELYGDRPKELWPRAADGELGIVHAALGFAQLLSELKESLPLPPGPLDL